MTTTNTTQSCNELNKFLPLICDSDLMPSSLRLYHRDDSVFDNKPDKDKPKHSLLMYAMTTESGESLCVSVDYSDAWVLVRDRIERYLLEKGWQWTSDQQNRHHDFLHKDKDTNATTLYELFKEEWK